MNWKLATAILVAGTLLSSTAWADTEVIGIISADRTWTVNSSPYILTGDVTVRNQATLTIEAGVEVRFATTDQLRAGDDVDGVELVIQGDLDVQGEEGNPVVFTGLAQPEPAQHATGTRVDRDARGTTIRYATYEGLGTGIDIRSLTPVVIEDTVVSGARLGLLRDNGVQDIVVQDSVFEGSEWSARMTVPETNRTISFVGSTFLGHMDIGDAPEHEDVDPDSSFRLTYTARNWEDSRNACETLGYKLAEPASAEDSAELADLAADGNLWLGARMTADGSACVAEPNYREVGSDVCTWLGRGYPIQIRTQSSSDDRCRYDYTKDTTNACSGETLFRYRYCRSYIYRRARAAVCEFATCREDRATWEWTDGPWGYTNWEGRRIQCFIGVDDWRGELAAAVLSDGKWRATRPTVVQKAVCQGANELLAFPPEGLDGRGTVSWQGSSVTGDIRISAAVIDIRDSTMVGRQAYTAPTSLNMDGNRITGITQISSSSELSFTRNFMDHNEKSRGGLVSHAPKSIIRSNQVHGGTYGIRVFGPGDVQNNVVTRSREIGILVRPDPRPRFQFNSRISSNTLVDNTAGIVVEGTSNSGPTTVANNIVIRGSGAGIEKRGEVTTVVSHNDVWEHSPAYVNLTPDQNAVSFNPLFLQDLPSDEPNFRLQTFSPLIDVGICDGSPDTDIVGLPRPFDGDQDDIETCDVGAYEFGPEGIFIVASGPYLTGHEVDLQLMGRSGDATYPIFGGTITVERDAGIYDPGSGRYRPTDVPGQYAGALRGTFADFTTVVDLDLPCGCPTPAIDDNTPGECNTVPECYFEDWDCEVRGNYCEPFDAGILPDPVVVRAGESFQVRGGARDQYGFVFEVEGPIQYAVVNGGGVIDENGVFGAGLTAGLFENTIQVDWGEYSGFSDARILPGNAARIELESEGPSVAITDQLQYIVRLYDDDNNLIEDAPVDWRIEGNVDATIDENGLVTAGCTPGNYPNAVVVAYGDVEATANLLITAGGALPTQIRLTPSGIALPARGEITFVATVIDGCGDTVQDAAVEFEAVADAGTIDGQSGRFTASCNVGNHPAAVTARYEGLEVTADITVQAGAIASVTLAPESTLMSVGSTQSFTATVRDVCDNTIDTTIQWSTNIPGAELEPRPGNERLLRIGCTTPGRYVGGVTATFGEFVGEATVEITAGETTHLSVAPSSTNVPAGETVQFTVTARDSCNNNLADSVIWTSGGGGTIDQTGRFTAGCTEGTFGEAVRAQSGELDSVASVTIGEGRPNHIRVTPNPLALAAGQSVQLAATPVDGCDNQVPGQVTYLARRGGTVTPQGLFTATTAAGIYAEGLELRAGELVTNVDVTVIAGPAVELEIRPNPIELAPSGEVQLTAEGRDAFDNVFDVEEVTWSANRDAGTVDRDGVFRAGSQSGDFEDAVTARHRDLEDSAFVRIQSGTPTEVRRIDPVTATLVNGQSIEFTAVVVDEHGNPTNARAEFSVVAGGGSISPQGVFTARGDAGLYERTVRAAYGDSEVFADIAITAAQPDRIVITPQVVAAALDETVAFSATIYDEFGGIIDAPVAWTVDPDSGASIDREGNLTLGCSVTPGTHEGLVRAQAGEASAEADVQVTGGATTFIAMGAPSVSVELLAQVTLEAIPQDSCGNTTTDGLTWTLQGEGATLSPNGVFTAGTVAGEFIVRAAAGDIIGQTVAEVQPGDARSVTVSPSEAELVVGESLTFTVEATDRYDNTWFPEDAVWEVRDEAGFIDDNGNYTAGERAGRYVQGITAIVDDRRGNATVNVSADVAAQVIIAPDAPSVFAGQRLTFDGSVTDQYGNAIDGADITWACVPDIGTCNAEGQLTAGKKLGTFSEAVTASHQGLSASTDVTVVAGDPAVIDVTPATATAPIGGSVTFAAAVFDEADAPVDDAAVTWTIDATGGQISAAGVVTAGNKPGTYTVTAAIGRVNGTSVLTIPTDFDEDGVDDTVEVDLGLDPTDPSDVEADPDGDGTSIKDEIDAGTDPFAEDETDTGGDGGEASSDEGGCSTAPATTGSFWILAALAGVLAWRRR